jgi:hypothetical protein
MNWLFILLSFQFVYMPNAGTTIYQSPVAQETVWIKQNMYTQFDIEALAYNHIFVGGGIKTEIEPVKNMLNFMVDRSTYYFNAGFRYEAFEVGYRHLCTHSTVPYFYYYRPKLWDGAYDEVYFKVTAKLGNKK